MKNPLYPRRLSPIELERERAVHEEIKEFGIQNFQIDLWALENLVTHQRIETVVEIGSWCGESAKIMADAGATVFCIDHWQGSEGDPTKEAVQRHGSDKIFKTFLANIDFRFMRSIFIGRGDSLWWAKMWPFPVDMVYIDADHRYEAVIADIVSWRRHVKEGGILAGHDYGTFPGVTRAVDEIGKDGVLGMSVWWKQM